MSKKSHTTHRLLTLKPLWGVFLTTMVSTPIAMAQTNFAPPTVLPGQNNNLGGYGDACIGLANLIRTGDLTLRQVPCFIKFFSQTLIGIGGTLAVIFVMIGGYRYIFGGSADKDVAKKTVIYALVGLAVSLMAWIFVDTFLRFVTE